MSIGKLGKDKREAQGDATRLALLAAARELFGENGYAATSIEEMAARAGVTKGAVYHHFGGKSSLFQQVYEQVMHEVSDRVVSVFLDPDHWKAVTEGCQLMIDAQLDPAVRRIALHDARSVLSWDVVHLVESRYGAVGIRGALRKAMHGGVIEPQPLRPLALLLAGAISEACFYVADADDPLLAREEVGRLIVRILEGLKVKGMQTAGAPSSPLSERA
ncbi:MAG TPA: TetR/AcrR family transcriptional regulator [Candidatus Dormibacteraeota bacterium]|jgi:AcrR family transcriptional regulator|nr:TetR/AcrR family transcriptional regulator [Candidatus Dormibacteraeota bacterium]